MSILRMCGFSMSFMLGMEGSPEALMAWRTSWWGVSVGFIDLGVCRSSDRAAVCGVDVVDEIVSEGVVVWCPLVDGVSVLLQG